MSIGAFWMQEQDSTVFSQQRGDDNDLGFKIILVFVDGLVGM